MESRCRYTKNLRAKVSDREDDTRMVVTQDSCHVASVRRSYRSSVKTISIRQQLLAVPYSIVTYLDLANDKMNV
jgi:hypothetical protein